MPVPRFSVVVPAYNGSETIAATIESVLGQTETDLELIVVDDGSADDTVAVVSRFRSDPRVTLIEQENQGTAAARNTGIAAAQGEYVAFLDNDDLWMPEYLAEAGAALDREPDAGFAYCDAWGFDDATRRFLRRTELESRPDAGPGAGSEATLEQLVRVNFVMSSVCTPPLRSGGARWLRRERSRHRRLRPLAANHARRPRSRPRRRPAAVAPAWPPRLTIGRRVDDGPQPEARPRTGRRQPAQLTRRRGGRSRAHR